MPAFDPQSPFFAKGGIVLVDNATGRIKRVITLQFNADTLTRTLVPQVVGVDATFDTPRFKGPPLETIKFEAELDATDQIPRTQPGPSAPGITAELALLEMLLYPASAQMQSNHRLASMGTLEIAPMTSPLTLFVWGKRRILPVRITDFSVVEDSFDPNLNPLRAKVSLGLRVLSVNDLEFSSLGGSLFMSYHQQKEQLATLTSSGGLAALGITGLA